MRMMVHVALWHHRHGVDVFVATTPEGNLKQVTREAVMPFLSEIESKAVQKKIAALVKKEKYNEAFNLWTEAQGGEDDGNGIIEGDGNGEYVEFFQTPLEG